MQLGGPGETSRVLSSAEVAELGDAAPHTEADVAFVTGMIHHHRQALEMTALVADRAALPDLALLAERMSIGQTDEIVQLEQWLTTRGEPVPTHGDDHGESPGSDHGDLMPGMLDDTQMAELAAASGETFDTLFLMSMIRHHEGAIAMVQALLDGGGGQEPAVFQLADGMSVDQAVEISRMKSVLAELVPPE